MELDVSHSRRRGFYGAFLMDNLELVEQLVLELSQVKPAVGCLRPRSGS
jgi:hypothetical protein